MAKKVLIVDDSAFMRMTLKNILTKSGYEIAGEACTGKEAIEEYEKLKPDFVTMDLIMPDMNGIEALQEIMRSDQKACVMIVSAMGQQALVEEAISKGARDFIIKPFKAPNVLEKIEKILS